MAPVIRALQQLTEVSVRVILSGQHQDLLQNTLLAFDVVGDRNLAVMRPNQSLAGLTARLFESIDAAVEQEAPDLVVAQGDTSTVMVAGVVAFYRDVPFAHVEAGLRTGNLRSPFPEEFNRIVAARAATLNFAPTETARRALLAEGVPASSIYVTGNPVIDALLSVAKRVKSAPFSLAQGRRPILLTVHRRENFGPRLQQILAALKMLAVRHPDIEFILPVHPNPNVRDVVQAELSGRRGCGFTLTEPLEYPDLVAAMMQAELIVTDSGGIQEEAPALGKPVLVLRTETERPEAIEAGVAKLIGVETDDIVREVTVLLTDKEAYAAMARRVSPYGDGKAASRIARLVAAFLGTRAAP
jgi:UDP-N-acetylglucosamine 2-epimerase (non-hydrolysing)